MAEQEHHVGREGGRWINQKPDSAEFGAWFKENMRLDPALGDEAHEKYVGGIVLIPATNKKVPTVVGWEGTAPIINEQPELSYIPYAKVDTRINYFWDVLEARSELTGMVRPETLDRLPIDIPATVTTVEADGNTTITEQPGRPGALGALVYQLPDGFSLMSVPVGDGFSHFLLSTIRVSIYRTADLERALEHTEGDMWRAANLTIPLRTGRGTKQVQLLRSNYGGDRSWADENSVMKAETGALGRALGFAGVFVIPGSGIATAEDMQDLASQSEAPVERAPETPSTDRPVLAPTEQAENEEQILKTQATELFVRLSERGGKPLTDFKAWAKQRKLESVSDAKGAMLRGLVRKLETLNDQGDGDGTAETTPEDTGGGDTGAGAGDGEPGKGDADAVRGNPSPADLG